MEYIMMNRLKKIVPILLVFLLLSSCAATRLTSVWKDEKYGGGVFNHIMVVGISEKSSNRKMFEDAFSMQLKAVGVNAVPSFTVIVSAKKLNKNTIQAAAEEIKADAILVTSLIAAEEKEIYIPPVSPSVTFGQRYQFDHRFPKEGKYAHTPGHYIQQKHVRLESNLYEAREKKMIWSATSETIDLETVDEIVNSLAKVVIKSLRDYKLIK